MDILNVLNNKKPSEYENFLDKANADYLSNTKDYGSINHSDLYVKIVFKYDGTLQKGTVFALGDYNTTVSSNVSFRYNDTSTFILISNKTPLTSVRAGSLPFVMGVNTIEIDGLELYLNGVLEHTFTDLGLLEFDYVTFPMKLGRLANTPSSTFWLTGAIIEYQFQTEVFKSSGNGLSYVGSEGGITTRNTGHSGGVNYVNHEMINKV